MAEKITYVSIDLEGKIHLVGRLWAHARKGRESASFQYDSSWLENPERFSLEPSLPLTEGSFHTEADKAMFGAIGDSAPDRWGRVLMRRAEFLKAQEEKRAQHTLIEIDYLLQVNDEARQGALRFSSKIGDEFLAPSGRKSIPPLLELPKLLSASNHFLEDDANAEDLKLLLAPGSSLGGARPKASIRDGNGQLAIAKFPRNDDDFPIVLWEAVALTLAAQSGIIVPEWRVETIVDKPVIIIKRFDRKAQNRIPFLSAMSMIGARDNEHHSYLELVDALKQYGAKPRQDIISLWRRIVFSILISNTDDHLRNHGFLYSSSKGWRLSPSYDMNPTPISVRPRILTTAIDLSNTTASLDIAISVASEFGLNLSDAKTIIKEVGKVVANWRSIASRLGISQLEINRMASAFEHEDLRQAVN